mmetsp:Transcript_14459/g.31363  ORF Transcript_14459/g.31363 Transcript_14459/m.31363 type:complete len:1380 (+) Transcript_14459:50-4189(+)
MTEQMHYATYGGRHRRRRRRRTPNRNDNRTLLNDNVPTRSRDQQQSKHGEKPSAALSASRMASPTSRGQDPPAAGSDDNNAEAPPRHDQLQQRRAQREVTLVSRAANTMSSRRRSSISTPTLLAPSSIPRQCRSRSSPHGNHHGRSRSPRCRHSSTAEEAAANIMSPAQSWNGRTRHYDKNRLKSFDCTPPSRDTANTATAANTVAMMLSHQLSKFDLKTNHRRGQPPRSKSSKTSSKSKSSNKKNGANTRNKNKNKNKNKKKETKSFLNKVKTNMPVLGMGSCKRYSQRRHRGNGRRTLLPNGNNNDTPGTLQDDVSGTTSVNGTTTTEDGSTAYFGHDFSSSSEEESDGGEGRERWYGKESHGESSEGGSYCSCKESDSVCDGGYSNGEDGYSNGDDDGGGGYCTESVGSYYYEDEEGEYYSSSSGSSSGNSSGYNDEDEGRRSHHSRHDPAVARNDNGISQLRRRSRSFSNSRSKRRVSFQEESNEEYSSNSKSSSNNNRRGNNRRRRQRDSLMDLLQENESLRTSVNALRSDFEAMMRQMNSIEDGNNNGNEHGDGDSITTNDTSSRVSHCLDKIEDIKFAALEKLASKAKLVEMSEANEGGESMLKKKEGETTAMEDVDGFIVEGERTLHSYQECIDDLLTENECLYHKIVTLSQEKEVILQEVHELRCSINCPSGNHCTNHILPTGHGGNAQGSGQLRYCCHERHCRLQLTDEKVAKSHTKCIDDIATLIRGIGSVRSTMEEDHNDKKQGEHQNKESISTCTKTVDLMGEEIMQLVSKILSQRDSFSSGSSGSKSKYINVDDENNDINVDDDDNGDDNHREPMTVQDEDDCRSEHDRSDKSLFSVCTVISEDDDERSNVDADGVDDDIHASTNCLFDGRCNDDDDTDDDDDASTLEIIYEYYSDYSEETGEGSSTTSSCLSRRGRRHSVASSTARRYHDDVDYNNDADGDSYSTSHNDDSSTPYRHNSKDEGGDDEHYNFPDEKDDIEYPPRGYHRYSPSSSRYSSSRSASRSSRNSSNSPRGKSKSFDSHCSSYAPSAEERGAASEAVEGGQDLSKVPSSNDDDGISLVSGERDDKFSQDDESTSRLETHENESRNEHEDQLVNAIESHLNSTVLMTPHSFNNTPSHYTSCASISASATTVSSSPTDNEDNMSRPSMSSGSSTKERKGICITVVSRASRHVSFPSSLAHTYMTFFRANLLKSQVDDVLEEQFQETREVLIETSCAPYHHANCSGSSKGHKEKLKKKYQGEYNEEGGRHGYGIYTSKNGNEYRGEWLNDNREGLGVVKVGNGDVFEGQFESNLKNGIGVYHYKDGECDLSRYKDDVRIGDTLRYSKDRGTAFLLSEDSSGSKTISLEEAAQVAKEMGTIVACC